MSPHFFNDNVNVVGSFYRGYLENKEFVQAILPGKRIVLVREPDNPKDRNAILAYLDDDQTFALGWVKREIAAILAPILDRGSQYKCYVERTYRPRGRFEIVVTLTTFPVPRVAPNNTSFRNTSLISAPGILRPKKITPTGKAFRKIADFENHRNMFRGKCGIYLIWNNFNKYYYVGQATDISRRWAEHYRLLSSRTHQNKLLQYDWISNGGGHFRFDVLELSDPSKLDEQEKYWITKLNSFKEGYNTTPDGQPIEDYRLIIATTEKDYDQIQRTDAGPLKKEELVVVRTPAPEIKKIAEVPLVPIVPQIIKPVSKEFQTVRQRNIIQLPIRRKGSLMRELKKEIDMIFRVKMDQFRSSMLDGSENEK